MTAFRKILSASPIVKPRVRTVTRKWRLAVPAAVVAMAALVSVHAQEPVTPNTFELGLASDAAAGCLPDATARVTVFPREERTGTDTIDFKASGLAPNTPYAVFLTELPVPPFGAVEYIGDFTTNPTGRGSLRVDAIVNEAFSSTVVNGVRVRKELNHVVIWVADPAVDDACAGPAGQVTTPFDGDGEAGIAVLSSKSFLPGAPLP
jgi:hypothetical protein